MYKEANLYGVFMTRKAAKLFDAVNEQCARQARWIYCVSRREAVAKTVLRRLITCLSQ